MTREQCSACAMWGKNSANVTDTTAFFLSYHEPAEPGGCVRRQAGRQECERYYVLVEESRSRHLCLWDPAKPDGRRCRMSHTRRRVRVSEGGGGGVHSASDVAPVSIARVCVRVSHAQVQTQCNGLPRAQTKDTKF